MQPQRTKTQATAHLGPERIFMESRGITGSTPQSTNRLPSLQAPLAFGFDIAEGHDNMSAPFLSAATWRAICSTAMLPPIISINRGPVIVPTPQRSAFAQ